MEPDDIKSMIVSDHTHIAGNICVRGKTSITPLCILGLKYFITITDEDIQIGCEFHSIEEWNNFTDKQILEMDDEESLVEWKKNKEMILMVAAAHQKGCLKPNT